MPDATRDNEHSWRDNFNLFKSRGLLQEDQSLALGEVDNFVCLRVHFPGLPVLAEVELRYQPALALLIQQSFWLRPESFATLDLLCAAACIQQNIVLNWVEWHDERQHGVSVKPNVANQPTGKRSADEGGA